MGNNPNFQQQETVKITCHAILYSMIDLNSNMSLDSRNVFLGCPVKVNKIFYSANVFDKLVLQSIPLI